MVNESIDSLVFNNDFPEIELTDIGSPFNNQLISISNIDLLNPDGLALALDLIDEADEGYC